MICRAYYAPQVLPYDIHVTERPYLRPTMLPPKRGVRRRTDGQLQRWLPGVRDHKAGRALDPIKRRAEFCIDLARPLAQEQDQDVPTLIGSGWVNEPELARVLPDK